MKRENRKRKKCDNCGRFFLILKSRVKSGRGKFCSRKCRVEKMKGKYAPFGYHKKTRKGVKNMKEQNGIKRYQVNIFCGSQSFIFRENSIKKVAEFTGIKKLTAQNMASFLSKLNDQVFGTELGGRFRREQKKSKLSRLSDVLPDLEQPDFIGQVNAQLEKRGAKTDKQKIKLYNKLTGSSLKTLKQLQIKDAQKAMILILQGGKK